jgi:UDP-N-acetylglucosamine transferase subunit ALG13
MTRRVVFVTVGSQMPFDRLCGAVDAWASDPGVAAEVEVFAQIGLTSAPPRHVAHAATLPAAEYEARVARADLVVAHAGTGTIFTALRHGTPVLVLARRADLAETRNDHQDATVARFEARGLVESARDAEDLRRRLEDWRTSGRRRPPERLPGCGDHAEGPLVERLAGFFDAHLGPRRAGG